MFKKIIYTLLFTSTLSVLFFFKASFAQASEEFDIDSTSTYTATLEGSSTVKHELSFINKKPNVYATQYSLSIASTRITDPWAKDLTGNLSPKVTTTANDTTIAVEFLQKAVGVGQTLSFEIGYKDLDVVQKIGRVHEINIPIPEDISEFKSYKIVLNVPNQYENPVQIIPKPSNTITQAKGTTYEFTKDRLNNRGVTALFGEKQIFSFDLRFKMKNHNPFPKIMQIALPPDTLYQHVLYDAIIPNPLNIKTDIDGNWLAEYRLSPGEQLEVHAIGTVILSLKPEYHLSQIDQALDKYLTAHSPWQTDDPEIDNLANKLKTPENIYNFVVDSLQYNYDRVEKGSTRLGAVAALNNPQNAICMEFTDLFIAIARAASIPARELNGFAYTQNPKLRPLSLRQDILHAWPEYFDQEKKQWVPVDPTWGNTTQGIDYFTRFDLNHIVFVIHGVNSQLPYPAGFYKLGADDGKDIIINPESVIPEVIEKLEFTTDLPESMTAGLIKKGKIKVKNTGNTSLENTTIQLSSQEFDILSPVEYHLTDILPYSTLEIPIKLKSPHLFNQGTGLIRITRNNDVYEKKITIKPIFHKAPEIFTAVVLGTIIAAASTQAGRLLLSRRKR